MKSSYQLVEEKIEKAKCEICSGAGKCDDAEPGDTFFREWLCKGCNGTGFKNSDEYIIARVVKA